MSTMPLSIGETHRFEDGLKLTVSDLTYYDAKPSFLDDPLYGPAVRFRVVVNNAGTHRVSAADLSVHVRCGADGVVANRIYFDKQLNGQLAGELLPGKSLSTSFGYQVTREQPCLVEITIGRGWKDEKGSGHWSGEPESAPPSSTPTRPSRPELLDEAMRELDSLVGLKSVKTHVRMLRARLRFNQLRESRGLPAVGDLHHLVFTGPPGTGKTTVARIVGKIFAGMGLLERGHVVECDRSGLVGRYLGHTADKTNKKVDEALDGVLFVDEAYGLANGLGGFDGFGHEALQTLLKRAEDDRDRLVIVLAGYPDEMKRMLTSNPGLVSRFSTRIDFAGLAPHDLADVFRRFAAEGRDELAEDAEEELAKLALIVAEEGWGDALGHARFARSWCDSARGHRALRVLDETAGREPEMPELVSLNTSDLVTAFADLTPPPDATPAGYPPVGQLLSLAASEH
jgi:hypothetical protein